MCLDSSEPFVLDELRPPTSFAPSISLLFCLCLCSFVFCPVARSSYFSLYIVPHRIACPLSLSRRLCLSLPTTLYTASRRRLKSHRSSLNPVADRVAASTLHRIASYATSLTSHFCRTRRVGCRDLERPSHPCRTVATSLTLGTTPSKPVRIPHDLV